MIIYEMEDAETVRLQILCIPHFFLTELWTRLNLSSYLLNVSQLHVYIDVQQAAKFGSTENPLMDSIREEICSK
jgi:hypothetical protein